VVVTVVMGSGSYGRHERLGLGLGS
jgi:hypothetical protein